MRIKRVGDGKIFKIGRNDPCQCGSGRKFKQCCLPKMEAAHQERKINMDGELKNDFRDEVANEGKTPVQIETERVGEAEMLRRDSYVTMRQLQVQKLMQQRDFIHNEDAVKRYQEFIQEMEDLPISEASIGIAILIEKQLKQLRQHLHQCVFGGVNAVTLAALEASIAASSAKKETGQPENPVQDTGTDDEADMDAFDKASDGSDGVVAAGAVEGEDTTAEELKDN